MYFEVNVSSKVINRRALVNTLDISFIEEVDTECLIYFRTGGKLQIKESFDYIKSLLNVQCSN